MKLVYTGNAGPRLTFGKAYIIKSSQMSTGSIKRLRLELVDDSGNICFATDRNFTSVSRWIDIGITVRLELGSLGIKRQENS